MKVSSVVSGHLAAFSAYVIFGLNVIVCKDIANHNAISPMALFCFRAVGATTIFWLLSFFAPKEKIPFRDLCSIFVASMFGLFLTQITFLKAITITTPFDTAVISTIVPIMTMFVSAIFLKEPITLKKAIGVLISFSGVLFLIFNSVHAPSSVEKSTLLGIVLMILNGLFFAFYLGVFRPLIAKYNVVNFMKWMFLFSMIVSLPFATSDIITTNYCLFTPKLILDIAYLIILATCVSYFLIPFGQKRLRPTIISMYSYIQPIIAAGVSIYLGMDTISILKIFAASLVFVGVAVVNQSKARADIESKQ